MIILLKSCPAMFKIALPPLMASALLFACAAPLSAVTMTTQDVDLGEESQQTTKWSNDSLLAANNPGFPNFPGAAAWPHAITGAGTADAELQKISGSAYPGGTSIYSGGTASAVNTLGATLSVFDTISGIDLQTVSFQIMIASGGGGYEFFNHIAPVLNYNGGTQALTASLVLLDQEAGEPFPNPETGELEDITIHLYQLQWDLSAITTPISSIDIRWNTVQHAQIYGLQLDVGGLTAVPEPATGSLVLLGIGALGLARRRSASLQ